MAKIRRIYPSDGTATLVLGIILSIVGAGMLLERAFHISLWDFLWKLWPVLLIAMGIKILVSHYRRPHPGGEQA
jgi:hypothetical protein